jgi:hypothetical protein
MDCRETRLKTETVLEIIAVTQASKDGSPLVGVSSNITSTHLEFTL